MEEKEVDEDDESSEEGEELSLDETSIEELVEKSQPQRRFAPQQDSFTLRQISPVLESRPAQQPLETDLQEAPSTQISETQNREFQPYYSNKYYSSPESTEYPEIMQDFSPVLEQDFSRVQQATPRLTQSDTNWVVKNTSRDWEKKYELKSFEVKKDRRNF